MQIKSSAKILIALSVSSVSLFVYSSTVNNSISAINIVHQKLHHAKCFKSLHEHQHFVPWNIISQILLRSAA